MKETKKAVKLNREDYKSENGIASWWQKDGARHIALPCADPDPETGLRTGGFMWTGAQYQSREAAIEAIKKFADSATQ